MTDPRYLAVKLLDKTFVSGSYSNLQLDSGLKGSDLDERGRKLCSAIYYGVIERRLTLDHIIGGLSSRPVEKLDSIVLNILRRQGTEAPERQHRGCFCEVFRACWACKEP